MGAPRAAAAQPAGGPPRGIDLEATQNDLLQPGWTLGAAGARRNRVAIQPPAPGAHGLRIAERPFAGGEEVEHHAEGEDVAARVAANPQELLRRDIASGADRPGKFLRQD